jgi:hypothetical protein
MEVIQPGIFKFRLIDPIHAEAITIAHSTAASMFGSAQTMKEIIAHFDNVGKYFMASEMLDGDGRD